MRKFIAWTVLGAATLARAQGAPDVVWQEPTPSLLANSVMGVSYSPLGNFVMVGSTDRWLRERRADLDTLVYSVLEPQHSRGVRQITHSIDGRLLGVQNQSTGLGFRVQRASDGAFLGSITATVGQNGIVTFAPDSMLRANTGDSGTLWRWRFSDLTQFRVTGSGYEQVTTTFNFSPNGVYQTASSGGSITVQRRSDGAVITALNGGSLVVFSPDSRLLATWTATPHNEIVLYRTSDWTAVQWLQSPASNDGVAALRFTPDSTRIVSTGYHPFLDADGLWQQQGIIRFWSVSDGAVLRTYDHGTDLAVTSPVAWSPDGTRFLYGLYNGTVAVATTPH